MVSLAIAMLLQEQLPLNEEGAKAIRPVAKGERIVAAYYYAWYDFESEEHLKNTDGSDALTHHPPKLHDLSYKKPEWHRKELADAVAAGIDVLLVTWSSGEALKALAGALESLEKAPRVAPCVEGGKASEIRAFFTSIAPRHWAAIDGKPLAWVTGPAGDAAPAREELKKEFGGRDLHVVAFEGWKGADAHVRWGAAREGPAELEVVAVGPGYDDTAVPGRKTAARSREKGVFYQRSWYVATRLKPSIVVVETWNNLHEATEICESRELGREYIEMTAKFAEKFKKGDLVPNPPGPASKLAKAQWNLKYEAFEAGLKPVEVEGGAFEIVELTGIRMVTTKAAKAETRFLAFAVDDSWRYYDRRGYDVVVEYLDKGKGTFTLEYDSADKERKGTERWHKVGGEEPFTDSGEWKTATFTLADALFGNHQAGGSDFRLRVEKRGLAIRKVIVAPRN
jgi:hypothetical protein